MASRTDKVRKSEEYVRVSKKCRSKGSSMVTLTPEQIDVYERHNPFKIITVSYYKKRKSISPSTWIAVDWQLEPLFLDASTTNPFYRDPFLRQEFLSIKPLPNVEYDPRLTRPPLPRSYELCDDITTLTASTSRELVPVASPVASTSRELVPVASPVTQCSSKEIDIVYEGEKQDKVLDSISLDSDDSDSYLTWNQEYNKYDTLCWDDDAEGLRPDSAPDYENVLDIILINDEDDDDILSFWTETIL